MNQMENKEAINLKRFFTKEDTHPHARLFIPLLPTLMSFDRKQQSSVKQLSFNEKKLEKKVVNHQLLFYIHYNMQIFQ